MMKFLRHIRELPMLVCNVKVDKSIIFKRQFELNIVRRTVSSVNRFLKLSVVRCKALDENLSIVLQFVCQDRK